MENKVLLSCVCALVFLVHAVVMAEENRINTNRKPSKVQYFNYNPLAGTYNFGYVANKTGPFHFEKRGPDNVTYGCYGHVDEFGRLQVTHYVADVRGYRVVRPYKPVRIYQDEATDESADLRDWSQLFLPRNCPQTIAARPPVIPMPIPTRPTTTSTTTTTTTTERPQRPVIINVVNVNDIPSGALGDEPIGETSSGQDPSHAPVVPALVESLLGGLDVGILLPPGDDGDSPSVLQDAPQTSNDHCGKADTLSPLPESVMNGFLDKILGNLGLNLGHVPSYYLPYQFDVPDKVPRIPCDRDDEACQRDSTGYLGLAPTVFVPKSVAERMGLQPRNVSRQHRNMIPLHVLVQSKTDGSWIAYAA